jgi:hypothetical protein
MIKLSISLYQVTIISRWFLFKVFLKQLFKIYINIYTFFYYGTTAENIFAVAVLPENRQGDMSVVIFTQIICNQY